jgi:hypothetical protein
MFDPSVLQIQPANHAGSPANLPERDFLYDGFGFTTCKIALQQSKNDFVIHTTQAFFPASVGSEKNLSFTPYAHLPHRQKNKRQNPSTQGQTNSKRQNADIKTHWSRHCRLTPVLRGFFVCSFPCLPFAVCLSFGAWRLGFAA